MTTQSRLYKEDDKLKTPADAGHPAQRASRSIEERVLKIVSEQFGIAQDSFKPEQALVADLGADSLDLLELVMALEDEFEIEVSDEEGSAVTTIGDAVTLVQKLKSSDQSKTNGV